MQRDWKSIPQRWVHFGKGILLEAQWKHDCAACDSRIECQQSLHRNTVGCYAYPFLISKASFSALFRVHPYTGKLG